MPASNAGSEPRTVDPAEMIEMAPGKASAAIDYGPLDVPGVTVRSQRDVLLALDEIGYRAAIGLQLEAVQSFIGWRSVAGLLARRLAGIGV